MKRVDLVVTVPVTASLVVASGPLSFVENAAQPDVFSSVPATLWRGYNEAHNDCLLLALNV
ncbi:hypothetical protein [Halegenticoccus soli]|uniref:hypothetical protein n=1 Tax=Halegenticoccus soli TaxID=1985678 RepID=UPI00117A095C|nr:hypothetical protein [Halegenticoccus soli]